MRWKLLPILAAVALVPPSALPGCNGDPDRDGHGNGLVIRPAPYSPRASGRNLYRLDVYYVTERLGLGRQSLMDLWRMLDDRVVPPAQRRLLAANGLRFGVGGELALKRLDAMIAGRDNVQVQKSSPVYAHQGYALDVPLGAAQHDVALLVVGPDGRPTGRHCLNATTFLRFQCLDAPDQPNTSDVFLSQWIIHGPKQPVYRQTPTGFTLVRERPRLWLEDLKTRLPVREGQILVAGPALDRPLSIGDHLFLRRQQPYTFVTTLILAPVLIAPGDVPPDADVVGETDPAGATGTRTGD